jgi:hypothetical protein
MESSDDPNDPESDGVPSSSSSSSELFWDSEEAIVSSSGWYEFCLVLRLVLRWGRIEGCLRGGRGGIWVVCMLAEIGFGVLSGGRGAFRFGRVYIFGTPGVRSV